MVTKERGTWTSGGRHRLCWSRCGYSHTDWSQPKEFSTAHRFLMTQNVVDSPVNRRKSKPCKIRTDSLGAGCLRTPSPRQWAPTSLLWNLLATQSLEEGGELSVDHSPPPAFPPLGPSQPGPCAEDPGLSQCRRWGCAVVLGLCTVGKLLQWQVKPGRINQEWHINMFRKSKCVIKLQILLLGNRNSQEFFSTSQWRMSSQEGKDHFC